MMVASDSLIWQPWRVTITSTATRRNKPGKLPAAQLPGRPCSIARSLDLLGEKWALLAVREVSFGNHRFNEIARNTGAARPPGRPVPCPRRGRDPGAPPVPGVPGALGLPPDCGGTGSCPGTQGTAGLGRSLGVCGAAGHSPAR